MNKIHYNFIRPHNAPDGATPAEAAGIKLFGNGNKWANLLKKGIKYRGNDIKDIPYPLRGNVGTVCVPPQILLASILPFE